MSTLQPQDLINKLAELSKKLERKDALGKNYKNLVKVRLDKIKNRIIKLLALQKKKIEDITQNSTTTLESTRTELEQQQQRLRLANEAAIQGAETARTQLQTKLDEQTSTLKELQGQLATPNPDTQSIQVLVEKLRKDLVDAQTASADSQAKIEDLKTKLKAYDELRDKMDGLVKSLFDKIGEILNQVDVMSINQADIQELMVLLKDVEDTIPNDDESSGNEDSASGAGGIFGNLFAAAPAPATEAKPPTTGKLFPPGTYRLPPNNPTGGRKTRRRRHKKTQRGGYILKARRKSSTKKYRKYTRTSKGSKGRRSSSSKST